MSGRVNQRLVKLLAGVFAGIAVLMAAGWLLFMPTAKEEGYRFITAWGDKGVGPGQFHDPTGVAVSGGEVFVSDARNGRIQVFDFAGNWRRRIGEQGGKPGQFGRPMNLTVVGGQVYVADYWNDRVQVYTVDGIPLHTIGRSGTGSGEFNAPGGVDVDGDGRLYVADFYNQRIQQLDRTGEYLGQWGKTGEPGIRAGRFNYPTDVAVSVDGTIYVADGYNDRVQVFSADGRILRKWGGPFAMNLPGPFNGWFSTVSSIAIGPEGNIFVSDFYNHRVQKFSADGTFLTAFGKKGTGPGQFTYPLGVAVAADGTVFVADFGNHRMTKWCPVDRVLKRTESCIPMQPGKEAGGSGCQLPTADPECARQAHSGY